MPSSLFAGAERVFNARNMSPERVAQTFVAPEGFVELCQETSTVVMGPRGSGKTTLLKMLTPRALAAWNDPGCANIQDEIPFDAIYIPTDIHWQEQLRALSSSIRRRSKDTRLEELFSKAAVTTNVLLAVLDTMLDIVRLENPSEDRPAADFLGILADNWKLGRVPPVPGAIREALEARFNELFLLSRRLTFSSRESLEEDLLPDWIFLDYYPATRLAVTAFSTTFPGRRRRKWALCFDELELAPAWLQNRVFSEIRSTDQRFLLKLSTSPLPNIGEDVYAAPSGDYSVIRLWPHAKRQARDFSSRLAARIIEENLKTNIRLEEVFGKSLVGSVDEESYSEGGRTWKIFKELAQKDQDFRRVLEGNGVDPHDPRTDKRSVKDQVLRKAKPLAHFRVAWLTGQSSKGERRVRTRKRPGLYQGIEDILDIADGNPRWLITILRQLLRRLRGEEGRVVVSPEEQEDVLLETSDLFVGFLRTLPDPISRGSLGLPLDELVETLGKAFEDQLLRRPFSLNPIGTARVDEDLPTPILNSLRWAAEQGALIVMDPAERGLDLGIEGRRLRLTYLLAPYFRLPLRAYKEARMTICLKSGGLKDGRLRQMDLSYVEE